MAKHATTPKHVEFPEDELLDDEYSRATLQGLRTPQSTLSEAAVAAAFKPAGIRRMQRPGTAVIVEIPSPGWAADVEMIVRNLASFGTSFNRTGSSKLTDRPTEGNGRVAEHLSCRGSVLGISTSPEQYLPSALVAAADVRVRIETPSNRIVAHVIRKATGRRPRRLPPNAVAGLDYGEICSCIRVGSTPSECVRRLASAVRTKNGSSGSRIDVPDLADLHGYDDGGAMAWAKDLVRDLNAFRKGAIAWEDISRTAIFTGPPGTGKSTLIRSIAKSAGVPFVSTSVSSWFTGGSNGHLDGVLREFDRVIALAASQAPAILFLDECEALPNRNTISNHGRDWWLPVINGVLLALDSTTSGLASRLIVIGATNDASRLDPALIRPGRLHPVIEVRPPDVEALAGIIRQHLGPDLQGTDVTGVARLGAGGTGADATAWVRDARRVARDAGRPMTLGDLAERVAPPDIRSQEDIILCARHEAAHATACQVLGVGDVKEVTILKRAGSGGSMVGRIVKREVMTRSDIENMVLVSLAGRAQDSLSGEPHTGAGGEAHSDLGTATAYVLLSHTTFGLGGTLTYVAGKEDAWDQMRRDPGLRDRVEKDLKAMYAKAETFVRTHQAPIEAIARRLVIDRILSGDEVRRLIAGNVTTREANFEAGGIDAR